MTVSVRLFARYREAAGAPSIDVEVEENATLEEVWARVRARVPSLRDEKRPLFACNRAYAGKDLAITGREEIAAFPPVSGG